MGMNYYLLKRPTEDILKNNAEWCRLDDRNRVIEHPNGGYIWNDDYYPTKQALEDSYYLRIHIGKSSAGWRFGLAVYPEFNIRNLDDWNKLFRSRDTIIINEEHYQIKPSEMLRVITKRRAIDYPGPMFRAAYEKEVLDNINKAISLCSVGPKPYATYDDLLRDSHGIRGPYGLIARDPYKDANVIPPEHHKATYDYIKGLFY